MTVKLAVTSDLYLPVTTPDRLTEVARAMAAFAPDAAVLGGDLGESLADFRKCLKLFRQELTCPVWVLAGERDFWARPPYDSARLWRELLPQAAAAAGCAWLEGKAFVLSGVGVAGSVAWYDYSSAAPGLPVTALEFAQHKYLHNADALRIDWGWSDPEFATLAGAALTATLDHLEQDANVRRVVVVTHFPILEQQLDRDAPPGRTFASAYLGNLKLGGSVLARSKVTHVVSGHTRVPRKVTLDRVGAPPVEARVLPADFEKPAWVGLTLE